MLETLCDVTVECHYTLCDVQYGKSFMLGPNDV